jgi:tetratricopeptide (TPR) repeat protein
MGPTGSIGVAARGIAAHSLLKSHPKRLATRARPDRWACMHRSASALLAFALVGLGCAGTAPLQPKAVQLNRAGTEALSAGDLETAEARFALALEYHPRFVEALVNLGLVDMQRGNFSRARLEFERARRINADLAQPHHALGVLAERERRPDVAGEHYREALRVNPGFAPSRGNLARMLFAAGRYDDAREQFLRLVEVAPTELAGRAGLAETLLQLDRGEESDAVVDRALRDFGPVPSLVMLAAAALLLPLTRAGDDNARAAWSWIAMGRLARRDDAGAFEACEKAFALDRNDALATYVVAMGLRGNRDRRALPWLERAHLLSPHNAVLFDELRKARAERR